MCMCMCTRVYPRVTLCACVRAPTYVLVCMTVGVRQLRVYTCARTRMVGCMCVQICMHDYLCEHVPACLCVVCGHHMHVHVCCVCVYKCTGICSSFPDASVPPPPRQAGTGSTCTLRSLRGELADSGGGSR